MCFACGRSMPVNNVLLKYMYIVQYKYLTYYMRWSHTHGSTAVVAVAENTRWLCMRAFVSYK